MITGGAAVVAGTRGEGALDLAPKPGCGEAAATAPHPAHGGVEGEGMRVEETSSMEPGGLGVRPTCGAAPHSAFTLTN